MKKKKGKRTASSRQASRHPIPINKKIKREEPRKVKADLRNLMIASLLLAFIFLLYLNSLGNEFTNWDDQMIYGNPVIRSLSVQNLVHFFTLKNASTYQPLRILTYAIDYHFWGLNPLGYRLTNIFFYLLTCIAIFFTSRLLFQNILTSSASSSDRMAFFTAFVFAAHPVHVEAVTWLSARKEVLHGFFFFLSFYLFVKAEEAPGRKERRIYIGAVLLTFLLSILSKPSAVVLPALFLLYEVTKRGGEVRRFIKGHWLFIGISLGISLLFVSILMKAMSEAGQIKPFYGGSMSSNLVITVYLFLYNIKLLAFTTAYSAAYTITASFSVLSEWTLTVFATTLFLFIIVFWSKKKTNLFFFSFFWFLITLFPFLNIIPISILLADRYVFIASFGYCLVVGFLLNRLYETKKGTASSAFFKATAVSLFLILIAGYAWMTVQQNRVWRNSFTLWADAVKKYPLSNLGNAMMGWVYLEKRDDQEAARYLERAIKVRPTDEISRVNLAIAYERLNQPEKALKEFEEAIRLRPDAEEPKIRLCGFYFLQKEYRKSEEILKDLLNKNPTNVNLYIDLGYLYKTTGRLQEAVSQGEMAIRLAPHSIPPYKLMGDIYLYDLKDTEKAILYYTQAIQNAPEPDAKSDELRGIVQDLEGHR